MNDLFLFVRPPRPLWPFTGPDTSFWPPLAFASLAAAVREAIPDIRVQILDAPIWQMGWRSLEARLHELRPTWVGIGEEAVSCVEGLRLARLAKDLGAMVIAGGCFFGHVAPQMLASGAVDIVVHGEGEVTLVELLQLLRAGATEALAGVRGISFRDGERVLATGPRPLLADLDRLPFPAYDLLPVERYGRRSRNHPAFAALELGRGCADACSFCVLWRQMGRVDGSQITPQLRTKSPDRLLAEIRELTRRYGRRYLGWVDPCFNAHPDVPARLAEALQRDGTRVGQSAWVRADALLRDEASGALPACVAAGLNEVYLGLERSDDAGLGQVNKREEMADGRRALALLARRYPQVFTVGSFIYGLPGDTPDTVRHLHQLASDLPLDYAFFIPLAPLPGTPFWRSELWDGTGERFRAFSFLPFAVRDGPHGELESTLLRLCLLHWPLARVRGYWRGLTGGGARKRRMTRRLLGRSARYASRIIWQSVTRSRNNHRLTVPAWYDR